MDSRLEADEARRLLASCCDSVPAEIRESRPRDSGSAATGKRLPRPMAARIRMKGVPPIVLKAPEAR